MSNSKPKRGFTSLESAVREETAELKHLESIMYWGLALAILFVASTCAATAVILTTRPLGVLMGDLVGPDGKPVKTGTHVESKSILSVATTNFADLAKLETIGFIYVVPGQHDATETLFQVTKVTRTEGVTTISGNPDATLSVSSTSANYTDSVGTFSVVLTKPSGNGRRSLAVRKLAWWNPFSWFSGSTSSSSTPAWKADTSKCPWACRQGWWWESKAYGKPACCMETKDSGSPYDSCQFEKCSCDAACRSCCDGN